MSTHPVLHREGHTGPSSAYDARTVFPDEYDRPLPGPPDGAATMAYRGDLAALRAFAAQHPPVSAFARTASSTWCSPSAS